MEVPLQVKENLRNALQLHMGGIFIENVCELYECQVHQHLPFRELGFSNIEAFLRAVPDTARLEYSVRERRLKVHGVSKFMFSMNPPNQNRNLPNQNWNQPNHNRNLPNQNWNQPNQNRNLPNQNWNQPNQNRNLPNQNWNQPNQNRNLPNQSQNLPNPNWNPSSQNQQGPDPFGPNYPQQRQMNVMPGGGPSHGPRRRRGPIIQGVIPDDRGFYTVCFPAIKKPSDLVGTLEEMFSVAGKVFEVYETIRWTYVCYTDPQSVQRAFKMFGHLGLKAATESALKDRYQAGSEKRKWEGTSQHSAPTGAVPRKKRKTTKGECHRVYFGNLNPTIKYSFAMFRQLLHAYHVSWITVKSSGEVEGQNQRTCAYILTASKEEAERMVKEYDGYVWHGHKLQLHVKIKQAEKLKLEGSSMDTSKDSSAEDDRLSQSTAGKHRQAPDMPGLEPAMPGLEPAMPGLEPALPKLEPARPRLEPAMPGLEAAMPGLEPILPPLEPAMPPLEPALPPLEPALPPLEPALPPLEPALPPLEPAMPGLESVGPLENLRVLRSFEVPTVLATNFKDSVDEAALASLFAVYHPKAIRIVTSQLGRKKAFIELGSVEDVKQAVSNLNQSFYNGQRIKVDVPFNLPELRKAVLGYSQLQASTSGAVTLSEVLNIRGHILQMLQLPDFSFHLGQQVEVLITAVISDKFFWGQVTDMRLANELQKISDSLNKPSKTEMMNGPGRCKAKFQGDGKWYRAWVMKNNQQSLGQPCRVFYLDYGNTSQIPWAHTAKTSERWLWNQPPMAIPFTLIEGVPNLKNRELTRIMVEVNALGNLEEGNMVVVRATSLVPTLKQTVSGIVRTVMV